MAQEVTPDAIMQQRFGYWGSKTLLSAVELGLFTGLAAVLLSWGNAVFRFNQVLQVNTDRTPRP